MDSQASLAINGPGLPLEMESPVDEADVEWGGALTSGYSDLRLFLVSVEAFVKSIKAFDSTEAP
jgi:hypothetical protein